MFKQDLKIETWPIERLIPYSRNARLHSEAQVAQIAASISEFAFNNPVLASMDGARERNITGAETGTRATYGWSISRCAMIFIRR
jgi:hypothetical protein